MDTLTTLIARARRDRRFARGLLSALTLEVTGDPVMVAWLGLFMNRSVERAA